MSTSGVRASSGRAVAAAGVSPKSRPADALGTEVHFHHSASLPRVLSEAGCSLLISTYQAGQVVAVGVAGGS
ncbi:MAG TPA: hypothetical protein VM688_00450 [Nocardioidaceae bacterium]|nr:hypothetical protein [Nocardioidaceae bacterium]